MESAEDNGERIAAELELLISSNSQLTVSSESSIFRIPNILSKHNEKAYLPVAFSFRPWHHDKYNLQTTQALKINYLKGILNRFSDHHRTKLRELVCAVHKLKEQARQCYAGKISFSDDELVQILVLDGCFISELFLKYSDAKSRDPDDPIFSVASMLPSLYHDLILLENQIPWFVLQHVFDLTNKKPEEPNLKLHQLAIDFLFSKIFSNDGLPRASDEFCSNTTILHVIDLLHKCLLAKSSQSREKESSRKKMEESEATRQYPSASMLSMAGVKFKPGKSKCILDIKFKNGVVQIPSLSIDYTTETIFRNLIAFEQCCYGLPPTIFTSYAKFMNNLIRNVDDFHVLCSNGIISNSLLSPEDAAQLFNKICHDAHVTHFHYDAIYKEVNSFYRMRLIRARRLKCCCCIFNCLCRCCSRVILQQY